MKKPPLAVKCIKCSHASIPNNVTKNNINESANCLQVIIHIWDMKDVLFATPNDFFKIFPHSSTEYCFSLINGSPQPILFFLAYKKIIRRDEVRVNS